MNETYARLAQEILKQDEFLHDYKILFCTYVLKLVGDEYEEPSRQVGLRLSRSAQILVASGEPESIDVGIRIIDMMLDLEPSYREDFLVVAETVFLSLGNFPNISLMNKRWSDRYKIERPIDRQLAVDMHRDINTIDKLHIDATNYQVDLWKGLEDGADMVTVAPTSAGKSYIIIQHIVQTMLDDDATTYAAFIVPSRALIYEVSQKIQSILSGIQGADIEVATIGQKERNYDRKTIFVLTQERLLALLHFQPLMRFSYAVVDEAQNIASGGRGVLLHIALSRLIERGQLQLIFSTPSKNYRNAFNSLLENTFDVAETDHSPVAKNVIFVRCKGQNLLLSTEKPAVEIAIRKGFKGIEYDDIVRRLGAKSLNIVYTNTKSQCEHLVKKLASRIADEKPALADASSYIADTVHADYSLVESIKKGIAFHYGPLPRNIRIMIENHVGERLIDYIVCTSTLAEGVNLPAKNLFIRDPKLVYGRAVPAKAMSHIQYRNIVGRAGRLMTHFSGNVFLVNYDQWEYPECTQSSDEEQLPTYFKVLRDNLGDVLAALRGDEETGDIGAQALNATANKLLGDVGKGVFHASVTGLLDDESQSVIMAAVRELQSRLELPGAILDLNPSIGVIQQNKLYHYIDGLDSIEELCPVLPHDYRRFRPYLMGLVPVLNRFGMLEIPGLENVGFLGKVCAVTASWARGIPLKKILQDAITWRRNQETPVNIDHEVRHMVDLIDNTIRFKLGNAVKCFCLIYTHAAIEKGFDPESIPDIYPYIEVGASDAFTIRLISSGLSRQTAIEVSKTMPRIDMEATDLVGEIMRHARYGQLHPVTRKEIEALHR